MINLFGVFNHFLKSFEPPNQLMPPPLNELEESADPKFYPPSLLLENICPKFDPPWLLLEYCPKSCCSKLNPWLPFVNCPKFDPPWLLLENCPKLNPLSFENEFMLGWLPFPVFLLARYLWKSLKLKLIGWTGCKLLEDDDQLSKFRFDGNLMLEYTFGLLLNCWFWNFNHERRKLLLLFWLV